MKKIILIVSILALILLTAYLATHEDPDGITVVSEDKINSIKEKYPELSDDYGTLTLYWDGQALPYDDEAGAFYVPVDMDDAAWETGTITGAYSLATATTTAEDDTGAGKTKATDIFFTYDYTTLEKAETIANGTGITFYAVTSDGYKAYDLVFTGMAMMTFTSTDYTTGGMVLYQLTLYSTTHDSDWVTTCYTTTKLRGNTSYEYDKKSLRLYLKEQDSDGNFVKSDQNLLGLREDDDWILNSLYADNTRLRDKLAIDLWSEVGANSNPYGDTYGTACEYVEVLINGSYQGIYGLMVPIDAKQVGIKSTTTQLAKANSTTVIERLYKKKYSWAWSALDFSSALADGVENYRGGFALKGNLVLDTDDEWTALYDLATIIEADDDTFASQITTLVDQQNLVENWLFYQAIAAFDNTNKNYYYLSKSKNGASYGFFIPWDMNISFGAVFSETNGYYAEEDADAVTEMVAWEPGARLLELDVENSQALAVSTWKSWRSGVFSDDAITQRMAELEHQLKDSGAFSREDAKWVNGNQDADFSYLYEFTLERLAVVDAWIAQYEN